MTTFAQIYCSINDLLTGPQPLAGSADFLMEKIKVASRAIQQEIGDFIPVTETRKFHGHGKTRLYLPPFIAITELKNDGTTITNTQYITGPSGAFWRNGPYNHAEIDPDATELSAFEDEAEGVEITARYGLYEETETTGATVATTQSNSAATLAVSDGSKLSPGVVAYIGTEQELVTGYSTPTSVTQLNGAIDATQETITVDNGALVKVGEVIRIGLEQARVIDINGHNLYLQRRWNNTVADDHANDTAVEVYRTFTVSRGVNGTTAAEHLSTVVIFRMLVPGNIKELCIKIAVLAAMQAQTSYSGRSGNNDTGQTYYYDTYPRFDLERLRDEYSIKTMG